MFRNENWEIAKMITDNIDTYVTKKLNLPSGKAFELYKKHGTALRGLQMEKIEFDLVSTYLCEYGMSNKRYLLEYVFRTTF